MLIKWMVAVLLLWQICNRWWITSDILISVQEGWGEFRLFLSWREGGRLFIRQHSIKMTRILVFRSMTNF